MSCPPPLWSRILAELRSRGGGMRESGGFLLGVRENGRRRVVDFIPYDEIDPNALRGAIVFDGSKMDRVWSYCEARGLCVVADVHTHPMGFGQSSIDRANPMIPELGHIALIVPNYADRDYKPGAIGIYEYRGRDGWIDHSRKGSRFFRVGLV